MQIRIEPFGVHIWNDDKAGTVFVETEVKNYGKTTETVEVVNKFSNADGKQVFRLTEKVTLQPGERKVVASRQSRCRILSYGVRRIHICINWPV